MLSEQQKLEMRCNESNYFREHFRFGPFLRSSAVSYPSASQSWSSSFSQSNETSTWHWLINVNGNICVSFDRENKWIAIYYFNINKSSITMESIVTRRFICRLKFKLSYLIDSSRLLSMDMSTISIKTQFKLQWYKNIRSNRTRCQMFRSADTVAKSKLTKIISYWDFHWLNWTHMDFTSLYEKSI
jgi:hypothetical protein